MFRHQKPMTADFLGLEKVVATNRFRQTGKNMMMVRMMQELIEDEANNRVSTYGHTGLRRMAGLPASIFVVDSMYGYEYSKSIKHHDSSHGYVSKRVGQKAPERVYDETFNPIVQAMMGMLEERELEVLNRWFMFDGKPTRITHVRIGRNAGKSQPIDSYLAADHRRARDMWSPRDYQRELLDLVESHPPNTKLH